MYGCHWCEQAYSGEFDLTHHVWVHHVSGWSCWCGEKVYTIDDFLLHTDRHGGLLPHYLESNLDGTFNPRSFRS